MQSYPQGAQNLMELGQSSQGLQNLLTNTVIEASQDIIEGISNSFLEDRRRKEGGEDEERLFTARIIPGLKINESEPGR